MQGEKHVVDELPQTVRDLRIQAAADAARAGHVFDRTITTSSTPMSRPDVELSLVASAGMVHGFALAEVLRIVEAHGDDELTQSLLYAVNDIGTNGDDGRCVDIWPDVERKLATGGVGTPQRDDGSDPTQLGQLAGDLITKSGKLS